MRRWCAAWVAALTAVVLAGCAATGAVAERQGEQKQDVAAERVATDGGGAAPFRDGQAVLAEDREEGRPSEEESGLDGEAAVRAVVEEFGRRLKAVSLSAPDEVVARSLPEQYGDLVSPELLERWQHNPSGAPGRVVSSPWPDHIEIQSVTLRADGAYEVEGWIVEMTSVELVEGGYAAKRPVTLVVARTDEGWRITDFALGEYTA